MSWKPEDYSKVVIIIVQTAFHATVELDEFPDPHFITNCSRCSMVFFHFDRIQKCWRWFIFAMLEQDNMHEVQSHRYLMTSSRDLCTCQNIFGKCDHYSYLSLANCFRTFVQRKLSEHSVFTNMRQTRLQNALLPLFTVLIWLTLHSLIL